MCATWLMLMPPNAFDHDATLSLSAAAPFAALRAVFSSAHAAAKSCDELPTFIAASTRKAGSQQKSKATSMPPLSPVPFTSPHLSSEQKNTVQEKTRTNAKKKLPGPTVSATTAKPKAEKVKNFFSWPLSRTGKQPPVAWVTVLRSRPRRKQACSKTPRKRDRTAWPSHGPPVRGAPSRRSGARTGSLLRPQPHDRPSYPGASSHRFLPPVAWIGCAAHAARESVKNCSRVAASLALAGPSRSCRSRFIRLSASWGECVADSAASCELPHVRRQAARRKRRPSFAPLQRRTRI
ncbi:hypothetical protein, conserved in T. vivax [Trypanosoma vivax Y486]|uniref:Uncharacterized protein n=1 Tax=Trypanosoma vivax (strain Y486) TaxID=1055687 RepID=F9WUP2_TRYVY|nr:hypothetical protein, conserved in T. vivax [Trypanosoma vivax Y486]|eukprot:CCD21291.1 hypothetical protein, conserved in T. vivax [Trypanosoma vivax Y486]